LDQPQITLIPIGHFEREFLEKTAEAVRTEFLASIAIRETHLDLNEYYDPGRRQYNGNELLKVVDALCLPESSKSLGLFNVDLFIPILTYIFGQAYLGGRSGIASVYRLSSERYGIGGGGDSLLERFTKEVNHELGHMFGLIHCHTSTCVMRSSTYVEDIDQKSRNLCLRCRTELGLTLPS
jgi:archaemetzincin